MNANASSTPLTRRREFLKSSSKAIAGTALVIGIARPGYCAEGNTIKIALIGCGGRGTGAAAQALATKGPTQLWAVADVFEDPLKGSMAQLGQRFANQLYVPPERQFLGLDAFKHAIDSLDKGSVVLLTTPPAFRPIHLEYPIAKPGITKAV